VAIAALNPLADATSTDAQLAPSFRFWSVYSLLFSAPSPSPLVLEVWAARGQLADEWRGRLRTALLIIVHHPHSSTLLFGYLAIDSSIND
jgi:hypothetical protein